MFIIQVTQVTIDQRRESGQLLTGTQVARWEGSGFVNYTIPIPTFNFPTGSFEFLRGKQDLINTPTEKYNRWVKNLIGDDPDVTNHHIFEITSDISTLTSRFKPTYSGITLQNNFLSTTGANPAGDEIAFKDPWLIDHPDPFLNNNKRNRGMKDSGPDALLFKDRPSPFYPDYSTGYNGDVYQGVFLNQPYTGINPVYYSVQAIDAQPLTVNGKATIWDWAGWKYDPLEIDLESPTSKTTAVVFKTAGATLTADMKGRRVSDKPEATFANNSAKLTRHWASITVQKPWLVYEDRGNIYAAEQDNTGAWKKDVRIAAATGSVTHHFPAVAYLYGVSSESNLRAIVWETLDKTTGTYGLHSTLGSPGDWWAPENPLHASVAGYRQFSGPSKTRSVYNTAAVAFRSGIIPKVSTETTSGIYLWFTYDDYTANVTTISSADFPTIANREYQSSTLFKEPHYMLAWQENAGIRYREVRRRYDEGNPAYTGEILLNNGYADLVNNRYPAIHTAGIFEDNKERTYVVWEALDEWTHQEKTGEKVRSQTSILCDAQSLDTPVICFRERQSSGWQPLVMFGVSNYCDRKPVVTSWTAGNDRNVMIAYEGQEGKTHYIWRDYGEWQNAALLNGDAAKPAVTTINGVPQIIHTDFQSAPHRVQHQQIPLNMEGISKEENTPPHSRLVYFRLKNDLNGNGNIATDGDISIAVGDPVLANKGKQIPLKPRFRDAQVNRNNAFEFSAFSVTESGMTLEMPLEIKGHNLVRGKGNGKKPLIKMQIRDANTNAVLATIRTLESDIFDTDSSGVVIHEDTLRIDLDEFVGRELRIAGKTYFKTGDYRLPVAEFYDLRDLTPGPLAPKTALANQAGNLPSQFALHQNYPKPFNPITTLMFDFPESATVQLRIFDLNGRLVKTVVDGSYDAGSHAVEWDGTNDNGQPVTSGMYFYRINATGGGAPFAQTRKMVLLR